MEINPWNIVFLAGFIIYVIIRGVFESRAKGNEKIVSRVDGVERMLMVIVFTGNLLLPLLYLFTPWLDFANYRLPAFAPWCGAALMALALWLFWRSHSDLGANWSYTLEMRKGHELVRHGVYSSIRHPMYASIILFGLAQGLLLENWLAGWSALATFTVMYLLRASREEEMMCEFFGDEYRSYMRETGRIIPRMRARSAQ